MELLFLVFLFGVLAPSVLSDLPGTDLPNLTPSFCTVESDCLNYYYSKCSGGTCVPCDGTTLCTRFASNAYCSGGRCIIPCTSATNAFCQASRLRCNPAENRCMQCYSDSDCFGYPSAVYCQVNGPIGLCVSCRNNADCAAGMTCQSYKCMQCTSDAQCTGTNKYCLHKYDENICVQCLDNSVCTNAASPACSSSNTCAGCTGTSDCTHITGKPACLTSTGTCVECMADTDCMTTTKSYCSPSLNVCQSCSRDSHCTHLPNVNKCWYGECVMYSPVCIPTYTVQITQESSLNDFNIDFDPNLVTQIDILSTIKIQLISIAQTDYSYTVTKATNTQFLVSFQVTKTIPSTQIEVQVPCPTAPGYVYANITKDAITKKIPFGSADLKAALATLASVATTATATVSGISGAMMFLGANPALLWGLLGAIQTFYYMIFINVQYPLNVQAFFPIFAMGNLDFIPNPMWIIFPDIDDFSLPVPTKFAEQNVDGLFLANAGNMILLWLGNIGLYVFSYLIIRYTRNMPKALGMICSKAVETFEWSGIFRVFITSYMELSIAAFLQLRVLTFSSGLFSASSVCGVIFGTFGILLPVLAYKIVQRYDTKPKLIKPKFGTLIEEYRLNDGIQKYFTVILIGRNLILVCSLVYLHNYPYIEIFTLTTLRFLFAYLLFKHKPYENKASNILNFISELVYGMVHIFIFILIHDDYAPSFSEQQRMDLGWGIICGCGLILMSSMAAMIAEQISVARMIIGLLLKVLKKEKKSSEKHMKKVSKKIRKVDPQMLAVGNESIVQLNQSHNTSFPSHNADGSLGQLNQLNDSSFSSQVLARVNSQQIIIKRPINLTCFRKTTENK